MLQLKMRFNCGTVCRVTVVSLDEQRPEVLVGTKTRWKRRHLYALDLVNAAC